jgi:hypothetical protein
MPALRQAVRQALYGKKSTGTPLRWKTRPMIFAFSRSTVLVCSRHAEGFGGQVDEPAVLVLGGADAEPDGSLVEVHLPPFQLEQLAL